jgi:hypothetical protein
MGTESSEEISEGPRKKADLENSTLGLGEVEAKENAEKGDDGRTSTCAHVSAGGETAVSDRPTSNPMGRNPENKSEEIRTASTVKNATEGKPLVILQVKCRVFAIRF